MRMLPCPVTCLVVSFFNASVRKDIGINESYITFISLRLLIQKIEDSLSACTCHYDGVHLHRKLVDIAHELLAHVKERNKERNVKYHAGNRYVRRMKCDHDTAADSKENVNDITDIVDDRCKDISVCISLCAVFNETVINLVEFRGNLRLVIEYLNDLLSVHDLLNEAFGSRNCSLLSDEVLSRATADFARNKHHDDDSGDYYQRHPEAVIDHDDEDCENDNTCSDDGRQCH